MLEIITAVGRMDFRQLVQVYEESIKKDGAQAYPHLDANRQILESEQDFYNYVTAFLRIPGTFYAVWTLGGCYRAALRIEPYKDGVLLSGLETAPDCRKQGFASSLIAGTLQHLSQSGVHKAYSHIFNHNLASIAVHQKCGFCKISDCALFLDGSVNRKSGTYLIEI